MTKIFSAKDYQTNFYDSSADFNFKLRSDDCWIEIAKIGLLYGPTNYQENGVVLTGYSGSADGSADYVSRYFINFGYSVSVEKQDSFSPVYNTTISSPF